MRSLAIAVCLALFNSALFAALEDDSVHIQLLGINDFHGNLEPPTGSVGQISGIPAGGVEFLATHIKALREGKKHSVTVSAGDLFGASPLLSAMFKDEPTVQAMNSLGLDINAVGNHEFDKGWQELLRLAEGECPTREVCEAQGKWSGARFSFLSANVVVDSTGHTLFPSYQIRDFDGVKIAFVGIVLKGTDKLVVKDGIRGISFLDEADTVNALIPELENQGVQNMVVLIHEGGKTSGGYNACPEISGPIVDIAHRLSDKVGVIMSGHTHQAYNCKIGDKLVTSAASNGRLVTEIYLDVDRKSGRLERAQAENIIVTRDVNHYCPR